uniref:Uncharacterized protein n=1 Tax=Cucumis melo TaxID=3656 RepID=A0A9I9ELC0_CUCME
MDIDMTRVTRRVMTSTQYKELGRYKLGDNVTPLPKCPSHSLCISLRDDAMNA